MSEEEKKPEVEPQNPPKENENPPENTQPQESSQKQENPSQPENPQSNEEVVDQEKKPEEEEQEQEPTEKIKSETATVATKEEDLFAGPYEKLIDRKFIPDPNYPDTKILPTENFNSEIKPRRQFFYNILITRQKREFEAPINNLFQDKNSSEEQTVGNNEVKGVKSANEYPMTERSSIEMGFQTDNIKLTKSFQVAKKIQLNSYTQTEHNLSDIKEEFQKKVNGYLSNQNQLTQIDNFLLRIKPKMEEALQSNETINIFMNDFDLDKFNRIGNEEGIKNTGEQEARTFRDNSAGTKNKKEKCVHWIRSIDSSIPFIAHSLKRNFTFEESLKLIGIPYQSSVLFWNVRDVEQNSPVFEVSTPGEVTCFEFDPDNVNNLVIALSSGQLMFIKFFDLINILKTHANTDMYSYLKKADIKEYYLYNLSSLKWTHQSNITAVKWFPPGYSYKKKGQMQFSPDEHESSIVVSLGEDGIVMIWDFRALSLHDSKYAQIINDVNDYLIPKKIEVNKVDSIGRIGGTGLEIEDAGEQKFYFYISTDEGQVYCVDMNAKNTADNPTGNVLMHYNNRYFRPVLYFERSPFFNDIFLTVHDFHFSLWAKGRPKAIFMSPNLDNCSYTCGKFSPSRPGVIYLCKSNGEIDTWDLLDESHKPSVKDTLIKEKITSINIFRYNIPIDENAEIQTQTSVEYMVVGDISGQMTLIEVPKLFSEVVADEKNIMKKFFDNEIQRQEYMEVRIKKMEEDQQGAKEETTHEPENEAEKEVEYKYAEEAYLIERKKIAEELGIELPKTAEELEKERKEKEKKEQEQKYISQTFNRGNQLTSHSVNRLNIRPENAIDNKIEYQVYTKPRSRSKEHKSNKVQQNLDNQPKKYKIKNYQYSNTEVNQYQYESGINDSCIIQEDDVEFIENKLQEIYPNSNISYNLVYRASEDGDKSLDFHKRCDKIGPNITFIKTLKGYIFGGFTVKNWEHLKRDINVNKPNLGSASRDPKAFGFSVNYQKIYNNEKKNEFAIWCNRNYGPTFKNNFFQIFDNCLKKGGYCSLKNNSHFGGQNSDYEITGGEQRFGVYEVEVFELIFE